MVTQQYYYVSRLGSFCGAMSKTVLETVVENYYQRNDYCQSEDCYLIGIISCTSSRHSLLCYFIRYVTLLDMRLRLKLKVRYLKKKKKKKRNEKNIGYFLKLQKTLRENKNAVKNFSKINIPFEIDFKP